MKLKLLVSLAIENANKLAVMEVMEVYSYAMFGRCIWKCTLF